MKRVKKTNAPIYSSYEEAMERVYYGHSVIENDMTMIGEALIYADNYGEDEEEDDDDEE
ncbi:MAG: hypothetical protein MJZ00_07225 [Paludibacteraceae bacterium]|nr:hypothetical protein [Paludibacteraceae bacterium]